MDSIEIGGRGNNYGLTSTTEKWNPLTYAIYTGNLDLIRFIVSKAPGNIKRLVKIPGLFKS